MAISPETLTRIEEILKCPVCLELLDDATFLPCGHAFCRNCIFQWHSHQAPFMGIKCPLCMENNMAGSFHLMRDGISLLPRNFIAQDLVEVARSGKQGKKTEAEPVINGLLPARLTENPQTCMQYMRRFCCWMTRPNITAVVLYLIFFWSVLREEDRVRVTAAVSSLCDRIHAAEVVEPWGTRLTGYIYSIAGKYIGRKGVDGEQVESFTEKLNRVVKYTSKGPCGMLKKYRRHRQAIYRQWAESENDK